MLCRAAFAGNTQQLMAILQKWSRDKWKERDPQGNTVSVGRMVCHTSLHVHEFCCALDARTAR